MKPVTLTFKQLTYIGLLICLVRAQPGTGNSMTTFGPINTSLYVPQGNPIELLGSAANQLLNLPAANIANNYVFPGDTAANTTKIFANMMTLLNNFLYTYSNITEPFLVASFNQVFNYSNQAISIMTQNLNATYAVPAKAAYQAYLASSNRSQLAIISANLTNTVNYYATINSFGNITAVGLAGVSAVVANAQQDFLSRNQTLIALNQTMNALTAQQVSDYSALSTIELTNAQSVTNLINYQLINNNASLAASGSYELANFAGSWATGAAMFTFPATCPVDGFGPNNLAQTQISTVYATMGASVNAFTTASNTNFATNNITLTYIDNRVNTLGAALNQLVNFTNVTYTNATQQAINNIFTISGIANDTNTFYQNLTNQTSPFVGQKLVQLLSNITMINNNVSKAFNNILTTFAPNSVEQYQSGLILVQINGLVTGMNTLANLIVASTTAAILPTWFTPQPAVTSVSPPSGSPPSGTPLPTTIDAYIAVWNYWNPILASSQALQAQYANINQTLANLPIFAAQSFNTSAFMNPFSQLLNTLFNVTNPFINFAANMTVRLSNYTANNSNFWQNLQQQVLNFDGQVVAAKANLTAYVASVVGRQRLLEVAQNKATADSSIVLSMQSANVNYISTMIAAFPTAPLGLQPTTSATRFYSYQAFVNPMNFMQIDACIVTALNTTCPTNQNFYYSINIGNLNLTNVPNIFLSTYISNNQTVINGTNGVLSGLPSSNPLYYNSNPPAQGPANAYYVGTAPNFFAYVLNLVSLSPTYLIVQLQASSILVLQQTMVLNVTIAY